MMAVRGRSYLGKAWPPETGFYTIGVMGFHDGMGKGSSAGPPQVIRDLVLPHL
jgi:hypothetical protein